MTTTLYSIIFGLIGIIFVQAETHRRERKDLYNRIMCRDIKDYNKIERPTETHKSKHSKVLERWRKKNDNQIQS